MDPHAAHDAHRPGVADPESRRLRLSHVIDHAAHLLPAQGPINVFIHHNTLHAFEDLPFAEAVKKGAQLFGSHPYLAEDRYRDELRRGRIRFSELQDVVGQDLGTTAGEPVLGYATRKDLRLAMLQYPLRTGPTEELLWYVAEADAMHRVRSEVSSAVRARMIAETRRWVMRDIRKGTDPTRNGQAHRSGISPSLAALVDRFGDRQIEEWTDDDWEGFTLQALWRVCCDGVRDLPAYSARPPRPLRHRDVLLEVSGADADEPVNELLIRFCAAFLDQGLAHWPLPGREEGFLRCFAGLYRQPWGPPDRWMKGLAEELGRILDAGTDPLDLILASLEDLGVAEEEWDDYLSATLLALRGWGGMLRQTELRGDRVVHPSPAGTLEGFLAIRLLLDRYSLRYTAAEAAGYTGTLRAMRDDLSARIEEAWPPSVEQRAFPVFQLAQVMGLSPDVLYRLPREEWETLLREIEEFSSLERRRVFHMAYERRFYTQTLDALQLHASNPAPTPERPKFQAIFCIDEREESIRRHLEELAPDAVTYATAGFFSVAMYYRGASDAHFVPLCPVVIVPRHYVVEKVVEAESGWGRWRQRLRRAIGQATFRFHTGTRGFALGAVLSAAVGVLASVPLIARTLLPRLTARLRSRLGRTVLEPPLTRLQIERSEPDPGPSGGAVGFTVDEMTAIAEKVLREIGLISGFSRIVLVCGHGSTSANNPHKSAYDCGACGGARGGPNGRALAQIFNDRRVRSGLAERGIVVPDETAFVGAMHNTSNDSVTYFDLDLLPASHRDEFETVRAVVERACDRDAHERCRRFYSAPLNLGFSAARQRVEARAEDLAQVRPELGHATNAICVVGRRAWTRGLFLDRRCFLTSYDPTQDDAESSVLSRILGAVFPVCSGINLEYYFSCVDNRGWGSGTKLPHNISALLGVMDGSSSDLRTGLPWQMVEIHEPVRLLFVIETTREKMLSIMDRNEGVGRLCRNEWVKLALVDPETKAISFLRDGKFLSYRPRASVLPRSESSVDWYRGWRDHLEFAEIEPAAAAGADSPRREG
ncbi:MAG: DUF2309 domain-containing protein [Isosphaeraceae bacterium]